MKQGLAGQTLQHREAEKHKEVRAFTGSRHIVGVNTLLVLGLGRGQ